MADWNDVETEHLVEEFISAGVIDEAAYLLSSKDLEVRANSIKALNNLMRKKERVEMVYEATAIPALVACLRLDDPRIQVRVSLSSPEYISCTPHIRTRRMDHQYPCGCRALEDTGAPLPPPVAPP